MICGKPNQAWEIVLAKASAIASAIASAMVSAKASAIGKLPLLASVMKCSASKFLAN